MRKQPKSQGSKSGRPCDYCHGQGSYEEKQYTKQDQPGKIKTCQKCGGTGRR